MHLTLHSYYNIIVCIPSAILYLHPRDYFSNWQIEDVLMVTQGTANSFSGQWNWEDLEREGDLIFILYLDSVSLFSYV